MLRTQQRAANEAIRAWIYGICRLRISANFALTAELFSNWRWCFLLAAAGRVSRAVGCWLFLPHPFSQRLRSEKTAAVWLPQDSQTSCSDLRHLFERSALARSEL